ncbi:MAG: membrane protein insertase YidC [Clostridia bacterium]
MDVITLLGSAIGDAIGKLMYNNLYEWVATWSSNWTLVGAFSVTVIIFTLFLKVIVSPLDVWQKVVTRKNAKKMEEMKPELDKVTKQCGANKELLMQKQRAVHKKYGYSTLSSCLPMIITMAVFFIVFAGFNSAVGMQQQTEYQRLEKVYDTAVSLEYESLVEDGTCEEIETNGIITYKPLLEGTTEQSIIDSARKSGEQAVLDNEKLEKFFFTKNIFVADTWKSVIPSAADFSNSRSKIDVDPGKYDRVMSPLMDKYSGQWNGFLMLPIVAFLINIASMKLNKMPEQPAMMGQTEEQQKAQKSQQKLMQYMMPVMMLVFAVMYSAAFTLYMVVNAALTTLFNLGFNIVAKRKDAIEKEKMLSTTVK